MCKRQKEVIFPSGVFIFARVLPFFFLYLKLGLHGEYSKLLLLIRSGDIEANLG